MTEDLQTTTVDPNAETAKVLAARHRPVAKLARSLPRVDEGRKSAEERGLGGRYRLIHGSMTIPVPIEQRLLPNGQENPYVPKQILAKPGDEVELDHVDALYALEHDIVEPLTARPSRVNQVCNDSTRGNTAWDYKACEALRERNAKRVF